MPGEEHRWERLAHGAAMIAAAVAIAAFWDGARMNRRSANAQTQSLAVSVLQDYMKLAIEHPALADRPDSLPVDDQYHWFASHAYFSAETIHKLTRGEAPWDSTVAAIVRYHHSFVRDSLFPCEDFDPGFVFLVKAELRDEFKCAAQD
jgi:hypothetical protein